MCPLRGQSLESRLAAQRRVSPTMTASRSVVALVGLVSLAAALGAGNRVHRMGDSSAEVAAVETKIVVVLAAPTPPAIEEDGSVRLSTVLADPDFKKLSCAEQQEFIAEVLRYPSARNDMNTLPPWAEISAWWSHLQPANQRIATAKAELRHPMAPVGRSLIDASLRCEVAARPWVIEERHTFWGRVALAAGAGAVLAAGGTSLLLLTFSWLWHFFLARVRELSDAVRGK